MQTKYSKMVKIILVVVRTKTNFMLSALQYTHTH